MLFTWTLQSIYTAKERERHFITKFRVSKTWVDAEWVERVYVYLFCVEMAFKWNVNRAQNEQ